MIETRVDTLYRVTSSYKILCAHTLSLTKAWVCLECALIHTQMIVCWDCDLTTEISSSVRAFKMGEGRYMITRSLVVLLLEGIYVLLMGR